MESGADKKVPISDASPGLGDGDGNLFIEKNFEPCLTQVSSKRGFKSSVCDSNISGKDLVANIKSKWKLGRGKPDVEKPPTRQELKSDPHEDEVSKVYGKTFSVFGFESGLSSQVRSKAKAVAYGGVSNLAPKSG